MQLTTKNYNDLDSLDLDDDIKNELTALRQFKPYLRHCLTINHDLNNSLSGVLGYSEYLLLDESNPLSEDQRGSVKQIFKSAEKMKKLIEVLCNEKTRLSQEVDIDTVIPISNKEVIESD